MRETGGRWDPGEPPAYFIASNIQSLNFAIGYARHLLVAINEIIDADSINLIKRWIQSGHSVFIDSGVFNLTNEHARKYGVPMDQALALAPDDIEGFDRLFENYCRVVGALKDDCWGYIEIDQGGRENKIKTRARLEAMGLSPIPVYHPLNDGWDYFDELASQYDRICFGNVVQADIFTRKRLLATAWERRRKYPHLWIHLLGYTPNAALNAFPVNSCDSSSWLSFVRFPEGFTVRAALASVSRLGPEFAYGFDVGQGVPGSNGHAKSMGAYEASLITRTWRALLDEYRKLGCDPRLSL